MRQATCDKCGICGIGQRPEIVVEMPNTAGAVPGDVVRVAIASGSLLRAAAVAYLIPLAALIGGYLLAGLLLGRILAGRVLEAAAIGTGFAVMALSYFWLRAYDRRARSRYTPVMAAILDREDGAPGAAKPPGC